MEFFQTIALTFKLSAITTFLLLLLGIPLAYFLVFCQNKFTPILETIITMPLILPPSVLGFYLLLAFNPENFFGRFILETFGVKLIFSFEGLVVASMIFSLPFMVNPICAGFASLPRSLFEQALILGKNSLQILWHVLLPNSLKSILVGIVICFAHTIGEFGVVMMIGGNIQGQTRLASLAIFDEVEALNYALAHQYALTLLVISFSIVLITFYLNKKILL